MAKLSAKQKQELIAKWTEGASYTKLAEEYGISDTWARKIVLSDPNSSKKFEEKKEQISIDVCQMMEAKYSSLQEFVDMVFSKDGILDKEKIRRTPINQLVVALGTMLDKYLLVRDRSKENKESQVRMDSILDKLFHSDNVD